MIPSKHPFNIQNYIARKRFERLQYNEQEGRDTNNKYYDILAEVYGDEDANKRSYVSHMHGSLDTEDMNDNDFRWYGLLEHNSMQDIKLCADYLQERDKTPTIVTGIFGEYPICVPVAMVRPGGGIFHEYMVSHFSYVYREADFAINKHGFLLNHLLVRPSIDRNGYFMYTLPVTGYGPVTVPVHELMGMTYLPKIYRQSDMFTYYHLNGDKTDNHMQNIGIYYG